MNFDCHWFMGTAVGAQITAQQPCLTIGGPTHNGSDNDDKEQTKERSLKFLWPGRLLSRLPGPKEAIQLTVIEWQLQMKMAERSRCSQEQKI